MPRFRFPGQIDTRVRARFSYWSSEDDGRIGFEILDERAGVMVFEAELTHKDFAELLSGQREIVIDGTFGAVDKIGKFCHSELHHFEMLQGCGTEPCADVQAQIDELNTDGWKTMEPSRSNDRRWRVRRIIWTDSETPPNTALDVEPDEEGTTEKKESVLGLPSKSTKKKSKKGKKKS